VCFGEEEEDQQYLRTDELQDLIFVEELL